MGVLYTPTHIYTYTHIGEVTRRCLGPSPQRDVIWKRQFVETKARVIFSRFLLVIRCPPPPPLHHLNTVPVCVPALSPCHRAFWARCNSGSDPRGLDARGGNRRTEGERASVREIKSTHHTLIPQGGRSAHAAQPPHDPVPLRSPAAWPPGCPRVR